MKKIIALLLVAVMCLSFVACNNESGNTETPSNGEDTENNGGSTNDEGKKQLTDEKMLGCIEVIEFTEENWLEYFYIEEVVEEETNSFGEVVDTNTFRPIHIKIPDSFAYVLYNEHTGQVEDCTVLECHDTVKNNAVSFEALNNGRNVVDHITYQEVTFERLIELNEFTFVRSSCKLVLFHIPEEYWEVDSDGNYFVRYEDSSLDKDSCLVSKSSVERLLSNYFAQ